MKIVHRSLFTVHCILYPVSCILFSVSCFLFPSLIFASAPELGIFGDTTGARQTIFGSAFTAVANDNNAMLINPAGLAQLGWSEVGFNYQKGLLDTQRNYISLSYIFGNTAAGIGIATFDGGSAEFYDTNQQRLRTIKAGSDFQTIFNGAVRFGLGWFGKLNYGLSAKIVGTTLGDAYSASTFAADTGLLWEIFGGRVVIGSSLRNLGGQLSYQGLTKENLPLILDTGIMVRIIRSQQSSLIVAVGTEINDLLTVSKYPSPAKIDFGTEYWFLKYFCFRAGYKYITPLGVSPALGYLSAGAGLRFKIFQLDYTWTNDTFFGDKHQISFCFKFRTSAQKKAAEEAAALKPAELTPATTTQTQTPAPVPVPAPVQVPVPAQSELTPSTTSQTQPVITTPAQQQ